MTASSNIRSSKKIRSTEFLLGCGVVGPPLFYVVLLIEGATRPGYNAWQTQGSYLALTNQGWEQIANFLVCGLLCIAFAVGPLLFVVVLLIEGATRPGYSAWHTFGSLLSLGDQGWMQITNFIVCGVLVLGFAIGLRQVLHSGKGAVWGPMLLGLFGLLLIIAGIFVTDPGQGYPVGVAPLANPTGRGIIHALSGLAIFIVVPIAAFVMSRRFAGDPTWRGWALYSLLTGLIMIVSFFLSFLPGANALAGLLQRVGIIAGWVWVSLLAIALLRRGRAPEVTASSISR